MICLHLVGIGLTRYGELVNQLTVINTCEAIIGFMEVERRRRVSLSMVVNMIARDQQLLLCKLVLTPIYSELKRYAMIKG